MKKPDYHILICNSYRVAGDAKGFCNKNGGAEFIQYVTEECADRGHRCCSFFDCLLKCLLARTSYGLSSPIIFGMEESQQNASTKSSTLWKKAMQLMNT